MTNAEYAATKAALKTFDILMDTREKANSSSYTKRIEAFEQAGHEVVHKKLYVGDYSARMRLGKKDLDYSDKITIERKHGVNELIGNFSTSRTRFEAELKRAKEAGIKVIIVIEDSTLDDLMSGNYISHMSPRDALTTYELYRNRYDVEYEWVSHENLPSLVENILSRFIMDDILGYKSRNMS